MKNITEILNESIVNEAKTRLFFVNVGGYDTDTYLILADSLEEAEKIAAKESGESNVKGIEVDPLLKKGKGVICSAFNL